MRAFQDMLLGPLKAVLMRALQQQLSKYIHNIELEGLGLLGGDVVLENLEIKKDVLHESLRIPTDYDISRGFIRELRIHIPWTRLQSRPIEIKFKTVEIIVTPIAHTTPHQSSSPWLHSRQSRPGEEHTSSAGATTGWLQQLLTKVLANMSVSVSSTINEHNHRLLASSGHVSNLVLKYEDADVVASAALKSLVCFSANPGRDWTPAFASLDDPFGLLHKLVRASDLTVCLDRYCAPDSTRRRQVQAFEVPLLNRASFDVRLLACVWLVAPGPPESSFAAAWEYQQAQVDWQDGAENDGAGIPSSPGRSGSRRGTQRGAAESPKPPVTPKTPRAAVTVLGRLVGGDRRTGNGIDEVVVEGSTPGAAVGPAEVETDDLPLPCVCPLLRDGWSRRASSSYSPFFDGERVWSPSEAAGAPVRGARGVDASAGGAPVEDSEEGGGVWGGGGGDEGQTMPTPIVVADVLIADLCFSLSNLQVQMVKELIDSAVHHVARNASRNTSARPLGRDDPRLVPEVAQPAASRWWPFWREAALEDAGGDPRDDTDKASYAKSTYATPDGSPAPFEARDRDAMFVVASASIRSVQLRLLTHHEREGESFGEKKDVEESAADDEPESISVPVHGLGNVSVPSAPVSSRKQPLRPPVAFVVGEVKGLVLDAHVLAGGDELSADVKVEVSSIVVRHAGLGDAASLDKSHHSTPSAPGNIFEQAEPAVSWGEPPAPVAPTANAEAADGVGAESAAPGPSVDRRPVADVQRLLVERARRLPRGGAGGEVGISEASPKSEGAPGGRGGPASAQAAPSPSPTWWADAPSCSATKIMPEECALQYRLLKRKSGAALREGAGGGNPDSIGDAVSTVTSHNVAAGALRVKVAEVLLEKILVFADVRSQAWKRESGTGPAGNPDGEEKQNYGADEHLASAAAALAHQHGLLGRANRLSPLASNAGSAVSSPRVLPFVQSFSSASTWETSFNFALRSVAVALDLDRAGGCGGTGTRGDYSPRGLNQVACCVLSLDELDISGSESASVFRGSSQQQRRGWHAAASYERRENEISQRVCSLSLGNVSVTFVDASAIAAEERAPLASLRSLRRVFVAASLPGTHRFMQLSGARVTAEILSEIVGQAGVGREDGLRRPISSPRRVPDFLFNTSVESLHVDASIGAALVVLEVCQLGRKMTGDIAGARVSHDYSYGAGRGSTPNDRWERCWRHEVRASFDGVSLGGAVRGGGGQVKGNMRRLSVGRGGDSGAPVAAGSRRDVADVALFEAMPDEDDGAGLSWTLEAFGDDEGTTEIELTSAFKSATLHYANTKKAVGEVMRVLDAWKAVAARIGVGMAARDAGDGAGSSSSTAAGRRSPSVIFTVNGSMVKLHLPFELNLEVKGVHLGTRPAHRRLPTPNGGSASAGLDINVVANDVQVFHALYGARCSPEDALPPAICCAARGIVTLRPSTNTTAVSLESEHVRAHLTPAFCASFGSFIRYMVGPPARPSALAAASTSGRVPKVFTFKLRVRGVDVDFIGDPCSPSAVSANIVVGAVSMRQKSVGETSPGAGSSASFGMSFETVEATQRRDPWRNAPALPLEAARLIGTFLGQIPGSDSDVGMSGGDLFSAWLLARKGPSAKHGSVGPSYTQPFIVRLSEEDREADGTHFPTEAFSVLSTSLGPRERLVNSLSLRLTPILLACYPPSFRLLVGHYNRFGGNAFRSFRSRADMPPRRIAVISYDIDIRGCSAVLLASLADSARGIHVSAGAVTIKENTAAAAAAVTPHAGLDSTQSSSLVADEPIDDETTLALSGFIGPAGMSYLEDWRSLLPAAAGARGPTGRVKGSTNATPLCVPIDLRWAVFYDRLDRCRQDISLSSVQLYLEQSHFDLCVRVAQAFIAADYPGALPPRRRRSTQTTTGLTNDDATAPAAGGQQNPVSSLPVHSTQAAAIVTPATPAANRKSSVSNIAEVKIFLSMSLRLPLVQCVLAVGKRNGPFPPVMEIDVASVRLTRGGTLTVRHVSVNSWSQEVDVPMRSRAGMTMAAERGRSGCGYRVLGRSGQSEESGKDFLRMEVRVPDLQLVGPRTPGPTQPQLDVVIQVQPFDIHVNPSIICSLTSYVTPIPLAEGSSEAAEVPFPHFLPPVVTPFHSSGAPSASAARDESPLCESGGLERGSSAGERVSTDFEKSAMTASSSVRLLASQVSIELSSYPDGPALAAGASHVFVRAITWPPDAGRGTVSGDEGAHGRPGNGGRAMLGPEVFARLSRVTCAVKRGIGSDGDDVLREDDRSGDPCRADEQGDTILKPFDIDAHFTRPRADADAAVGIASKLSAARGWHAGIYVDELYLRFGAVHTRSLDILANLFFPAMATASLTTAKLARGQREHGTATGKQWHNQGHVGDLRELERVECAESAGETTVTPEPGEAVFYGIGPPREGQRENEGTAHTSAENVADGWVHCCEWRYWGLRRVAQIALPYAPLRGVVPLLEGLAVDSLEVELSFMDPLTQTLEAATRFNVPCHASGGFPNVGFPGRQRVTVEPSRPFFARTWRLSWRIPAWLRSRDTAAAAEFPDPCAISVWSSLLLQALSVHSSPVGPAAGPSYFSTTLVAQKVTLAILTDGNARSSSSSLSSVSSRPPSGGGERDTFVQLEEIVRMVISDVNVFAAASSAAGPLAATTRGSAEVAVDVQDFSNFLRLPLLSHAQVKWDLATNGGRGGAAGSDEDLLSPLRPVTAAAVEVHSAIVSVSVTSMQCVEQCIAELSQQPSGAIEAGEGSATGETHVGGVEGMKPSASVCSTTPQRQPRQRSKRYVITNLTDRVLWFGQGSTTEALLLRGGEETSYRWRTTPAGVATASASRKGSVSRLVLMLRLALHFDSGELSDELGADSGARGDSGPWTEPFPADDAGTYMRLLQSTGAGWQAGAKVPLVGLKGSDPMVLPLWVVVTKEGLQTRIMFHGEWVFTNHLPQEVQVAWVTSAGVGDASRRLVEPVGMRGRLNLAACGPDKASDGSDSGEEAEVPHPVSCSALTACLPSMGSEPQGPERFSELMLEFRMATPDASTVVGSVGPPPHPGESPVAHATASLGGCSSGDAERSGVRRVGEGLDDDPSRLEEDGGTSSAPWLVTRQSEWVEARPCVYLSLISCASPDPQSSGFWFWCVASRKTSPLSDCAASVSRAVGHSCHQGQMMIDLRPVAVVWNRCSQPMRVALNFRGGRGEWRERNGPASTQEVKQDQARAQDERVATRERHSHSAYRLSGSSIEIQPGGRTAACQQPFVDYDLAVTPVPMGSGRGSESEARPFLVSVPSELLSRRCESRWLPLHSRALMDNVLCPLVVIASRLVNADWPSLSLRVYPGLSMHNHLRVPLSLRVAFTRQALDVDWAAGKRDVAAAGGAEDASTMQDEQDPLLRREASAENALPTGHGGGDGDGHGGSSGATQDTSASSLVRIVQAPAESCHSTWDIFLADGYPIPYVLPGVSLELGIAPEETTASSPVSSAAGVEHTAVGQRGVSENATGAASHESVKRRSRKLKARLDDNFRELVLIPWGAESDVVLPVFVTLEREQVLGGVELIKLAVYPRVVVHNATGLPISLSLLGAAQIVNDGNQRVDGDAETRDDAVPVCRVRLTPEGSESSMNVLALPGKRGALCGPNSSYHDSSRAEGVADAGRKLEPAETHVRRGLFGKLSWLLGSSSYSISPQPAGGFFADLEVAFGWDDAGQSPASGDPTVGEDASVATSVGGQAANDPGMMWRHPGVSDSAIFSVGESSGGVPFRSEPSSLKVVAEGGQRVVRVCIAAETPDADLPPPTRHILLYQDPQPDITVCNRSRGPITLLFDCGALVEVYPGCTVEHSWLKTGKERNGKRERSSSTSSAMARPSRPPSATYPDHPVRGVSEMSDASTPTSSAPGSPAASNGGRRGSVGSRPGFVSGPGSIPAAAAARKARPSGKLGGDPTLRHCFQCKGGSNDDAFVSWSDPLWVARGVQVIHFDNHVDGEGFADFGGAIGGGGAGDGSDADEAQEGFGAGSAREVQVHVVERAGGFLMSFAEGGFDVEALGGVGVEGSGGESTADRREVLRRWATAREHHVVVSVSGTTLQLLDDSNLQAVTPVGQEGSQTKTRKRETAARAASEGLGVMDDWAGGAWGEPGGFLSNGASTHPPAAALPSIISVFVDASSARLWQTAPAVRPEMSALDLERSCHLKDRVGIDVRLGTLQIDNHVDGHSLPVLFCFREGGALVSANGKSGSGGDVTGDCRLTVSLVLAMPWKESRVPSYLEKVFVRSAPIDVCLEDSLLPSLLQFLERAGLGIGAVDGTFPIDRRLQSSLRPSSLRPQLPPALGASMVPRLFIQRVDIGVLVVRATVQGYIPGKQVFLALDKSPLMFRPVSLRGVLARPDQIAEQIASNYAVDALLRSLAVVGSLEALGSPTTLLSAWGKGVYDLFAMPIKALPQGPSSTVKATFRGLSSLLRHASAGTLSSVSGVTNALSRNLGSRGGVVRPIAGTMGLVHRTSRSLIASTGVDSEWTHAKAATEANPAVAHLNADLWYRWCLLPEGHEFLYQTPALCSNASYSQANVPVTIVLSSKAVFLYRGGSGCEELWKQIEHQDITLIEQSADHAPAELILNARAYRRPRSASSSSTATSRAATQAVSATPPAVATAAANVVGATADTVVPGRSAATLEAEEMAVGGLLIKLSLPSSAWCRELAQLLHGLSGKA